MNFAIGVIHYSRFIGRFYQLSQMPKCVSMILGCVCCTCEILSSNIKWQKCKGQKTLTVHDDVIKWKHFPRYWPYVRGIHRSPVNSPHKGQWCGALIFPLICTWINGWVNNGEAGDLRRHCTHYDVIVKVTTIITTWCTHSENWAPIMMNHFIKFYYFMRYKLQNRFQIFNLK